MVSERKWVGSWNGWKLRGMKCEEKAHLNWVKEGLLAKEIMEDVDGILPTWFNEVDKR